MTGIGDGIGTLFVILFCLFPLGVWKAVEILFWIYENLHWGPK